MRNTHEYLTTTRHRPVGRGDVVGCAFAGGLCCWCQLRSVHLWQLSWLLEGWFGDRSTKLMPDHPHLVGFRVNCLRVLS